LPCIGFLGDKFGDKYLRDGCSRRDSEITRYDDRASNFREKEF
jgi:hypothetical protein